MPFNTLTVGAAVTPSVVETYFSHYLKRGPLREKPTAHISYHEGLRLVRQFLDYSSKHTLEELQNFTTQWVPAPSWVRINDAEVAPKFLDRAALLIRSQLGHRGCNKVGGTTWWQWRPPESPLRAEWIEMKKEYHHRKRTGEKCDRVILYVHGGAYYFGSVDEHRYQMQRHARKLKARVLAPRYRLAPQYPFPCGLYDCLATYFYLLEHFEPSQIIFAGDSAGGGMVLSMLVTLRDQGQPLPAGTILLSPWVDLTHSFPSVAGDGEGDYIPPHGFMHKPSMAWPPPPTEEFKRPNGNFAHAVDAIELPGTAGLDMRNRPRTRSDDGRASIPAKVNIAPPSFGHNLGIVLDGRVIEMREQIQIYTTNDLLAHPLVSPVLQPSLGGLPPMLIQVGGAELLRDEQIYIAHKAAHPTAFPPSDAILDEYDPQRTSLHRYPPTDVQLQVWEDLCHVPHTLSFTRPAKYMYRSVAQFAAWALAHAQHTGVEIQDDDAVSIISTGDEAEDEEKKKDATGSVSTVATKLKFVTKDAVGKAGDPIPPFKDHMIRQRVTRHGIIYALAPASELQCLMLDPVAIGTIKPGPVRKWLAAKRANDQRFASEKKKIQKKRAKESAQGYDIIPNELPPPTALAGRRKKGLAPEEKKKGKSWGLAVWSGWGSSHDEQTLQREEKTAHTLAPIPSQTTLSSSTMAPGSTTPRHGPNGTLAVPGRALSKSSARHLPHSRRTSNASMFSAQLPWSSREYRPKSPFRRVTDAGHADLRASASSPNILAAAAGLRGSSPSSSPSPVIIPSASTRSIPLSRRTSITTSPSPSVRTSRPVSPAAGAPMLVAGESDHREPDDNAHNAPIPTMSTIAPLSEKIPWTDHTYLGGAPGGVTSTASSSSLRPHDGTQAYPFKLAGGRSNPSLRTLDGSGREEASSSGGGPEGELDATFVGVVSHSELAGDVPMPAELGDGTEHHVAWLKKEEENEEREEEQREGDFTPVSAPSTSVPVMVEEEEQETGIAHSPPTSIEETAARVGWKGEEENLISPVDHAPAGKTDDDPIVSPIEGSGSVDDSTHFASRNTIFDPRTSMLGSIGADGMPNAHHEFPLRYRSPENPVASRKEEKVSSSSPDPAAIIAAATAATSLANKESSSSVVAAAAGEPSSDADTKTSSTTAAAAPFKLRNPVYDPRDPDGTSGALLLTRQSPPSPPPPPPSSTERPSPPQPSSASLESPASTATTTSATAAAAAAATTAAATIAKRQSLPELLKSAPFKLRHAVVEPKVAPAPLRTQSRTRTVQPDASPPTPAVIAAVQEEEGVDGGGRGGGKGVLEAPPPTYDVSAPNTHITLPEPVKSRPRVVRNYTEERRRVSKADVDGDEDDHDDAPPTPPPKDEAPTPLRIANKSSPANASRVNGSATPTPSKSGGSTVNDMTTPSPAIARRGGLGATSSTTTTTTSPGTGTTNAGTTARSSKPASSTPSASPTPAAVAAALAAAAATTPPTRVKPKLGEFHFEREQRAAASQQIQMEEKKNNIGAEDGKIGGVREEEQEEMGRVAAVEAVGRSQAGRIGG